MAAMECKLDDNLAQGQTAHPDGLGSQAPSTRALSRTDLHQQIFVDKMSCGRTPLRTLNAGKKVWNKKATHLNLI